MQRKATLVATVGATGLVAALALLGRSAPVPPEAAPVINASALVAAPAVPDTTAPADPAPVPPAAISYPATTLALPIAPPSTPLPSSHPAAASAPRVAPPVAAVPTPSPATALCHSVVYNPATGATRPNCPAATPAPTSSPAGPGAPAGPAPSSTTVLQPSPSPVALCHSMVYDSQTGIARPNCP